MEELELLIIHYQQLLLQFKVQNHCRILELQAMMIILFRKEIMLPEQELEMLHKRMLTFKETRIQSLQIRIQILMKGILSQIRIKISQQGRISQVITNQVIQNRLIIRSPDLLIHHKISRIASQIIVHIHHQLDHHTRNQDLLILIQNLNSRIVTVNQADHLQHLPGRVILHQAEAHLEVTVEAQAHLAEVQVLAEEENRVLQGVHRQVEDN